MKSLIYRMLKKPHRRQALVAAAEASLGDVRTTVPSRRRFRLLLSLALLAGTAQPAVAKPDRNPAAPDTPRPAEAAPAPRNPRVSSMKVVSPLQRSDNLYRRAVSLVQRGHLSAAQTALRQALEINAANHDARQMLAAMQVEAGRYPDAMGLLRDGLALVPGDSAFAMALARLQVAAGAKTDALSTLEQGLASAGDEPEYQAFLAALLQNQGRHDEAIQHYLLALRSDPSMPAWLIGAGISLEAEHHLADAAEAFRRAIDTGEATPELTQFAEERLSQIRQPR